MIVALVEGVGTAAHADDEAVGNGEHGCQSSESGHGDLHCYESGVVGLLAVAGFLIG